MNYRHDEPNEHDFSRARGNDLRYGGDHGVDLPLPSSDPDSSALRHRGGRLPFRESRARVCRVGAVLSVIGDHHVAFAGQEETRPPVESL